MIRRQSYGSNGFYTDLHSGQRIDRRCSVRRIGLASGWDFGTQKNSHP
jgi:hypothetical protein